MKKVLEAKPLEVDPMDYFDEKKKVFSNIPVFPLITEEEIEKAILESIDKEKFAQEIEGILAYSKKKKSFVKDTAYIICLINWDRCPELSQLLTIMREWAFRNEGGGVGENDYDNFDELDKMEQLIILDTEAESVIGTIIGGYRYMVHDKDSYHTGPMGDHFVFSETWKNEKWIELGRSFINPWYQKRHQRLSFDLVLHGLGYIYAKNMDALGYFGKITLYNVYERQGADKFFLAVGKEYFRQSDDVTVVPSERIAEGELSADQREMLERDIFKGLFYMLRKDYQINMVPIMAVYNRMTDLEKMYYFGAFKHYSFGDSIEMGIAIAFNDIYETIIEKFARPYMT
ncbi:GNAT family N-acyltransferase [Portibacter lacus]|uniref:Hemolysin A n=1 Tax=Portibacter lacus TaxID=1099794 RepID=A0AA37WDD4_9BACT|nr:GNAT family N-acyltransferase [Portibacter lacus]GLR15792.1 hemolysin A [Portibacter lacus]